MKSTGQTTKRRITGRLLFKVLDGLRAIVAGVEKALRIVSGCQDPMQEND